MSRLDQFGKASRYIHTVDNTGEELQEVKTKTSTVDGISRAQMSEPINFVESGDLTKFLSGPRFGYGVSYVALAKALSIATPDSSGFVELSISDTSRVFFIKYLHVKIGDTEYKFRDAILDGCVSSDNKIRVQLLKDEQNRVNGYQVIGTNKKPAFILSIDENNKLDLIQHDKDFTLSRKLGLSVTYKGSLKNGNVCERFVYTDKDGYMYNLHPQGNDMYIRTRLADGKNKKW